MKNEIKDLLYRNEFNQEAIGKAIITLLENGGTALLILEAVLVINAVGWGFLGYWLYRHW